MKINKNTKTYSIVKKLYADFDKIQEKELTLTELASIYNADQAMIAPIMHTLELVKNDRDFTEK